MERSKVAADKDVELVTSPLVIPGTGRKIIADILSHRYEKVFPKNRPGGILQSLSFEIEPSEKELTDLQDTFIYFRWCIKSQNNDGSLKAIPSETFTEEKDKDGILTGVIKFTNNKELVVAEPAAPLSIFQDVYLTINDVPFPAHTQGLYFYSLYWRLLLESTQIARNTSLRTTSNFVPREPGFFDQLNPSINSANRSLMHLNSLTRASRDAETLIPFLNDWTSFRRALPPRTKLDVTLDRARCLQYIMSSETNDNKTFDIEIKDAYLIVKRLTLEPQALSQYNSILARSPAPFPYIGRRMRAFDIPKSSLAFEFDVGSQGTDLPFLIRFGLVQKIAFDGTYKKSVYKFERFGLQQIRVKESNGFISTELNLMIPNDSNSLTSGNLPAFTDGGFSTDQWMQKGASLSEIEFNNGYAIYTLDLSRSSTAKDDDPDLQSAPRREKVSVILDFSGKLDNDVVLILEEQSNKVMWVGGDKSSPSFD